MKQLEQDALVTLFLFQKIQKAALTGLKNILHFLTRRISTFRARLGGSTISITVAEEEDGLACLN